MYYPHIAVIDIGSNSARVVIYQQLTSNSFELIYEEKSKVRIGEGAYLKEGYLQDIPLQRAYQALKSFKSQIIKYPNLHKTICVATSALRDAPNGQEFVNYIKKELNIDINIIDGKKEAYYGALASLHLLPVDNGISIDIGGGSTDIGLIKDSKIVDTYSLDLGTVRLKELFSDRVESIERIEEYINQALNNLPKHFISSTAIAIGGTARSLSKVIMKFQVEEDKTLHNFSYKYEDYKEFFSKIVLSNNKLLKEFGVSKNRLDTIREGTLIWKKVLDKIQTQTVISSAVGVREGLFLENSNLIESKTPIRFLTS